MLTFGVPSDQTLARDSRQDLQFGLTMSRPDVLDVPRPAPEERTICTAIPPDAVLTVRAHGDAAHSMGQDYRH
jgi:hypothetical protein